MDHIDTPETKNILNLNKIYQGKPFDTLSENVYSDHAAIAINLCCQNYLNKIYFWNVSNIKYHYHFGSGPFAATHMFSVVDDVIPEKKIWLSKKYAEQINQIYNDFVSNKFDIMVIAEGSFDFFETLESKLKKDNHRYELVSNLKYPTDRVIHEKEKNNVTGILINKNKYGILGFDMENIIYKEDSRNSTLILPTAFIKNRETGDEFTIVGVHLPGCKSQYPENGLGELNNYLNMLIELYPNNVLVALGDFNTVPSNLSKKINKLKILEPIYPTHINPANQIVVYDNVVYHFPEKNGNSQNSINYLELENMDNHSIALVQELIKNIHESGNKLMDWWE